MAIGDERRNAPAQGSDEELRALITRIAESDTFASAPAMRTLLLYLWEHRGQSVGEYAIGVDALSRPESFDPKTDSTVRVNIARLRAKLKDFYSAAEPDFPLLIHIPRGRHDLVYEYRSSAEPVEPPASKPRRVSPWIAASAALLIACIYLLLQNRALRSNAAATPLPTLWNSFVSNGKAPLIVVPSPLLFYWRDQRVYVRDLSISTFPNWPKSTLLSDLAAKWGPPEFAQTYVGAMEMTTGVRLLQYLNERALGATLIESRRFSPEQVGQHNTIFLGMPRTTAGYLDGVIERLNFYLAEADPAVVRSRDGQSPAEFRESVFSADRRVHPAIIAYFPPRVEGTRSILLVGRHLTGAATLLTTREGHQALDEALVKAGRPEAWEIVVETEAYRDTALKTRVVAIRPIAATFWSDVKR